MKKPKGNKKPTTSKKKGDIEVPQLSGIITDELQKLKIYLQNSEWTLIKYMIAQGKWNGNVALLRTPANYDENNSSIDLGLFAYWLNNKKKLKIYNEHWIAIDSLIFLLNYYDALPKTQMTDPNYAFLQTPGNGLIYTDGSVLNAEPYATYDQQWFTAFLNLLETIRHGAWYFGDELPPIDVIPINVMDQKGELKIAILGDWGTGESDAKRVMKMIQAQKPDYVIHLGDVYYSGTPDVKGTNGTIYFNPGEETKNLLDIWPKEFAGRSFTMNSNHEMYSGANGLIDALKKAGSPFRSQDGQTCFLLRFGGWNLLGLDSAYMSKSYTAFMDGDIGESNQAQRVWIKNLQLDPNKTIVFTHHNGFEFDGSGGTLLWNQVVDTLGGDPYAWYWGHVHNGLVYKQPISIPPAKGIPGFTTRTFARCSGHAAIPYGNASALEGNTQIAYRPTEVNRANNQLYNGFNMLTLKTNRGVVTNITEEFFDLSPKTQPSWVKTLKSS